MTAIPSNPLTSPILVPSCALPIFFCTFADDEEHPQLNPLILYNMKINWAKVVIDLLKLVIAALGGGYTVSVLS